MIDLIALSAAKKHADLLAMGLISVSVDNTNKSITFTLTADGSQHTIYFDQPSDGVSIIGVEIKNGHLICLMSDGSEIDAGVLPSGGSSGSSGSNVQPDWNQNDDTQSDYIKNRPFYESQQYAILVDNVTVNIDKYSYQAKFTMPYILEAGITYTLTDNGYSEEVTAYQNGDTVILQFMDEGFEIQQPSGGGDVTVFCMISGKHTVSIAGYIKAPKPIDEKYIPELSSITIKSSTEGSTKKFKITVDDSGTLSATEIAT